MAQFDTSGDTKLEVVRQTARPAGGWRRLRTPGVGFLAVVAVLAVPLVAQAVPDGTAAHAQPTASEVVPTDRGGTFTIPIGLSGNGPVGYIDGEVNFLADPKAGAWVHTCVAQTAGDPNLSLSATLTGTRSDTGAAVARTGASEGDRTGRQICASTHLPGPLSSVKVDSPGNEAVPGGVVLRRMPAQPSARGQAGQATR